MKKDYSEILRRLECGPFDGITRDAAYMAIKELVAERDARDANEVGKGDTTAPVRPKPPGYVTMGELADIRWKKDASTP
jgi:hypothetical protein